MKFLQELLEHSEKDYAHIQNNLEWVFNQLKEQAVKGKFENVEFTYKGEPVFFSSLHEDFSEGYLFNQRTVCLRWKNQEGHMGSGFYVPMLEFVNLCITTAPRKFPF